ncbi:hypothetical protein V5O48_004463 [Marasmius crinis-equi]|uniref:Uncharacterized protein n=1 Tax=Marasmius crinis-equi TaxID=585013 RepID=A0ABR3FQH3_9AGAR
MPEKVLDTPFPVIDIDPHFSRVVQYFRPSDYMTWAAGTLSVPAALLLWEMADPRRITVKRVEVQDPTKLPKGRLAVGNALEVVTRRTVTGVKVGALIGFVGGFLLAYQNSSSACYFLVNMGGYTYTSTERFWGWTENQREVELDYQELSQRAKEGKPLYGESHQPEWVQGAAHRNSVFSQLKFSAFPMFNFVNHQHHGTDPAKYGVKTETATESS